MTFGNLKASLWFLLLVSTTWFGDIEECAAQVLPYQNTELPVRERVNDLLSRMSLQEKISELGNNAPAIERLGIAAYNYWNEALHGVLASGMTSFPQAIALSSTWDESLMLQVASAISDEARAKNTLDGKGLTYWSPVINMARDPRWGRMEETYGEDPLLTARMAQQFIRGMQGNDPRYLKTVATVKHFACNNVEFERHSISSDVDERSLREYYLPAFKSCVTMGGVASVMSAYNALNGVPCPANRTLLTNILRHEWGFNGYVVSDCDAVDDIFVMHRYVQSAPEATSLSIKSGTDLNCGTSYQTYGNTAIANGIMTMAEADSALARVFTARFLLGEFDPPGMVPYTSIPVSVIDCQAHRDLALQVARESVVLLKNQGDILPLNLDSISSVAVIGPNAGVVQLGGYSGTPVVSVTPLQGILDKLAGTGKTVGYAKGCSLYGSVVSAELEQAVTLARNSDVAIVICGTDLQIASEEHDRVTLDLPGVQDSLIRAVFRANPNTIVVLVTGSPLSVTALRDSIPGIICSWYNGQAQGSAMADILFGDFNPGGKLTSTWYQSVNDLPPMAGYNIKDNRTYLYFTGAPLFPFGHGLSYTSFEYSNLIKSNAILNPGDSLKVTVTIENTGGRAGDEVLQCYVRHVSSAIKRPLKELKDFYKIALQPSERKTVMFTIRHDDLAFYDDAARSFRVAEGALDILIGSSSEDIRLTDQVQVKQAKLATTYRQDARGRFEAENFEKKSSPLILAGNGGNGQSIKTMAENDFVEYKNVDFGQGFNMLDASVLLDPAASAEGTMEIRLDSLSGIVSGTLMLDYNTNETGYQTKSCMVKGLSGVHDLYFLFKHAGNGFFALDWFSFRNDTINPHNGKASIQVYPNPASSQFYLKYLSADTTANLSAEFYSLQGILIRKLQQKTDASGVNKLVLDTDAIGLKQGMYLIRCSIGDYSTTLKLCVVK